MALPAGIARVGACLPRLRLPRARIAEAVGWASPQGRAQASGARTVCNWDEDALTLGVEAARSALQDADSSRLVSIALASTTFPFADRDNAAFTSAALDLPQSIRTQNLSSSLRAGVDALAEAARSAATTLVVASDARHAQSASAEEMSYGHGAAAFLLAPLDNHSIAQILGAHAVTADFVDHYRMAGEPFDYAFEERWVREEAHAKLVPQAIMGALQATGLKAEDIQHCVMPFTTGVARRVADGAHLKSAKLADNLALNCGDTGTPHALLMLANLLESAEAGETILVVGFGQGVTALILKVQPAIKTNRPTAVSRTLARGAEEASYVRYLSHAGLLDVDFGMRSERDNRTAQSVAYRKRREVTAFVGGRCSKCGTVQFPKSRVCVNPDCRQQDTQAEFRLANTTGRVKSFTEDWQAYSPRPPYLYGNIEFKEGGNLLMECTDFEPGELATGATVRFAFRIKDVDRQRGFQRYFWKAVRA